MINYVVVDVKVCFLFIKVRFNVGNDVWIGLEYCDGGCSGDW